MLAEAWAALDSKAGEVAYAYEKVFPRKSEANSYDHLISVNETTFTTQFSYSGCGRGCCPSYEIQVDFPIECLWDDSYIATKAEEKRLKDKAETEAKAKIDADKKQAAFEAAKVKKEQQDQVEYLRLKEKFEGPMENKEEFTPPYTATLGRVDELEPQTWSEEKGCYIAAKKQAFMYVHGPNSQKIAEIEINTFKGPRILFQAFKQGEQWFGLYSTKSDWKVISLPQCEEVASIDALSGQHMGTIYIPRFQKITQSYDFKGETRHYESFRKDNEIEEDKPWYYSDFAIVSTYYWYHGRPEYARIIKLNRLSEGVIEYLPNFWIQIPEHLSLLQSVNLENYDDNYPYLEIASAQTFNVKTGINERDEE